MPMFIVESYGAAGAVADQRARAELIPRLGTGISYIRTTIVPGDQTLLHVFEATSPEALRDAVATAELECDRIVEVVEADANTEMRPRRSRATLPSALRDREPGR